MTDLRLKLLEAHVQHELAQWLPDAVERRLVESVRELFRWFAETKLDDVVTRTQITGVIQRYVIEFRVGGGITELSGEMSRIVFTSEVCARTRLDDVVPATSYAEFADKVLALERALRELITRIAYSAGALALGARLTARNLLDLVSPTVALPIDERSVLARVEQRIRPVLERRLSSALESYLRYARRRVAQVEPHIFEALGPDHLRSVLDDLWTSLASLRLSEVFAFVGEQDIDDFVVLVFEFWNQYRKTEFFQRISDEAVDFFFGKYGQHSVGDVIEDMGVTQAMVSHELKEFLMPLCEQALRSGALEQAIRMRLGSFYQSPCAQALVGS